MPTRQEMLVLSALIAAALAMLSILTVDVLLAVTFSSVPPDVKRAVNQGVIACEWLFGFRVSPYLYGALLVLGGIAAMAWRQRTVARLLVFISLAHLTARLLAGVMKRPFSRLRPTKSLRPVLGKICGFLPWGTPSLRVTRSIFGASSSHWSCCFRGIGNNSPFYLFWFPWLESW